MVSSLLICNEGTIGFIHCLPPRSVLQSIVVLMGERHCRQRPPVKTVKKTERRTLDLRESFANSGLHQSLCKTDCLYCSAAALGFGQKIL